MAKVKFNNRVKYKGVRYPAYEEFEVDDKDVSGLIADGAFVVEAPKATTRSRASKTTSSALDEPRTPKED
jgi:hypothetical protein